MNHKLFAFDSNGTTNCSGTPTTCSPMWTAALNSGNTSPVYTSPAVANGNVYAGSDNLAAFDAMGNTNCSGTPKTCTPLWSYNVTITGASPSVANGLLFIGSATGGGSSGFNFMAFDANGNMVTTFQDQSGNVLRKVFRYSYQNGVVLLTGADGAQDAGRVVWLNANQFEYQENGGHILYTRVQN